MPWDSFRRMKRGSKSQDDVTTALGCFSKSGSSLEARQRELPKDVYQKIKEVDQQTSTLSALNPIGLSARVLDRKEYMQQLPNGLEAVFICQTVEIIKKPGQTLGIYLREGNGIDRTSGVFVSRLMEGCDVEKAGVLSSGDEIISVNDVDVTRTSIDDVVVMISIPRRLVLKIRTGKRDPHQAISTPLAVRPVDKPVVILKQIPREDSKESVMTDESKPLASSQPLTTAQTSIGTRARIEAMENLNAHHSDETGAPFSPAKQSAFRKSYPVATYKMPNAQMGLNSLNIDKPAMPDRWSFNRQLAMHSPRLLDGDGRPMGSESLGKSDPGFPGQKLYGSQFRDGGASTLYHTAYILPPKLQNTSTAPGEVGAVKTDRRYDAASYSRCKVPSLLPEVCNTASQGVYSPRTSASESDAGQDHKRPVVNVRGLPGRSGDMKSPGQHQMSNRNAPSSSVKSNSLPRLQSRRTIRWSNELVTKTDEAFLPQTSADVSDSDGVVSAPELSLSPIKHALNRCRNELSAKTIDEVFSRAEYQAWAHSANRQLVSQFSPEARYRRQAEFQGHPGEYANEKTRSRSVSTRGILSTSGIHRTRNMSRTLDKSPHMSSRHVVDISPLPRRRYPLQIASSNVSSYLAGTSCQGEDAQSTMSPFTGLLIIQIYEGRYLRASSDTEELYCVIEVDSEHRARTEVQNKQTKFHWRESFEIDVWECKVVDLYIYSWHPQFHHKLRHRGSLDLLDNSMVLSLLENRTQSFALNLQPKGQLLIRLGFLSMLFMYRRQLALRPSAYWGIPLATLVEREATGYGVPILVMKLIQEIERRGLDTMGLYILCGSVEKKLWVVSEIEKNPAGVDLSQEVVPDINVLASVFKDWLCALPEPLVSGGTYQTLVDAWRVCIPDDKEGNCRLIFGVLDCLPNVNKCTLIAVMDHLKSVLSQSPHNGLPAGKLCRVFAPLLFCTSVATSIREKLSAISLLDYKLATQVMSTILELWPSRMNNSDSNGSENGGTQAIALTKEPVSLMNLYWKSGRVSESSC